MPAKGKAKKNHGNPGADVIDGQATDEFVDGKSGDDAVSGGSGNDWVKGGSGNDLLTYTVEDNETSSDQYDGGSGIDDLLLDMTFDSWMRLDVQDDIARYLPWLEAHLNKKGMATGQSFEFDFASLLARKIENLRVRVDGVELNPEDEAVTLTDDAFAWTEDQVLPGGNVLLNDDVPDLVRSVELVAGPAVGSISIDVSGQFSYDYGDSFQYLSLGESAFMSFSYRVTDADMDAETATVNIEIIGVNDAPVALSDTATVDEDSSVSIDATANDYDVDQSDTFSITAVEQSPLGGIASIVDGSIVFDSNGDFEDLAEGESREVVLGYEITDDKGASAEAEIAVTVTGVNDAPVANDDSASGTENEALLLDVLANDTDVDTSDVHTVDTVTLLDDGRASSASGSGPAVSISNNQISFNPGAAYDYLAIGEEVTAEIEYSMSDDKGASDTATLLIQITGTNDRPVATADVAQVGEDDSRSIDVLANDYDTDDSDTITISDFTQPDNGGTVSLVNGEFVFDSNGDFEELAEGQSELSSFSYQISDDHGATDWTSVDLTVVGANDAPVARMDDAEVQESGSVLIDVLRNDSDIDTGDELTISSVSVVYGGGSASVVDGEIRFDTSGDFEQLAAGQEAEAIVEYTVTDKFGATATSAVFVTVNGEYDAPVLLENLDSHGFGSLTADYATQWHDLRFQETGSYTSLSLGGGNLATGYQTDWDMSFNNTSLFGLDADPDGLRGEVSGGFQLDTGEVNLINIDALWDDVGTGAEFKAGFDAQFGVELTPFVEVNGGSFSSEQGVLARILNSTTNSEGFHVLSTMAQSAPWSEFEYDFPDSYLAGIDASVNAAFRFFADAKGEFLGADLFNWSTDKTLFDSETDFNLIEGGINAAEGGLTLSLLDSDPVVYTKDIKLPKGIGQIIFYDESNDTEASLPLGLATTAFGSQSIAGIRFDFDDILGNLPKAGVVFANLDNKWNIGIGDVGGVQLDYTFLGAGFSFDLDLAATSASTPEFTVDLLFDRPVYVDGFDDPVMALRNADWLNLPGIKSVDGSEVSVTPYFNSQFETVTDVGINLVGTFDYTIGEIGARVYVTDVFDTSLDLGPLLSDEIEVFDIELIGVAGTGVASTGYDQFAGNAFVLG